MEELQDWVESLLNLQETDCRLDRMREQISSAPEQKKEAQTNLEAQHKSALEAKEEVRKKELEISSANSEIDKIQQQINKNLEQTNTVKDNKTYRALLDEVESLKGKISDKEDGILVLMEELEEIKEAFKETQAKLKEAVDRVEQMISDLDVRVENCKKQISVYEEKRVEQAKLVDPEILSKYTRIKSSHGGRKMALVEVNAGKCGYCHLQLTTQEILSASKHVPLTTCGNCNSLLYS
ncbi:MAG: hypothetical protein NE327_05435 [Lentisphaeraceae bacterium]|nr:hypothetical protein [Lentisphaeraceae bacterium]